MAEISKLNGYDLKDKQSRADIETLKTTVEGKLDKVTTADSDPTCPRAYYVSRDGKTQGVMKIDSAGYPDAIAQYDNGGRLTTGEPVTNLNAANKGYVDGLVDDIKDGTIKVGKAEYADSANSSQTATNAMRANWYDVGGANSPKTIGSKFSEVEQTIQNVANGVNRGYSFNSIDALIGDLEGQTANTKYKIGDELYIKSTDKPDYWVAEVKDTKGSAVTSISDGATVGYWVLYKLGEKTDLTLYQTKTDTGFATTAKTVTGAVNEVKVAADYAKEKAEAATEKFEKMGYTVPSNGNSFGDNFGGEPIYVKLDNTLVRAAMCDWGGNSIYATYIKSVTASGQTVTVTKGDGTKSTFTTQDTTYAQATSTVLGLVKIGYASSGKNYAVALDADGKMYVNVPWTDTVYTLPVATTTVRGGVKVGAVRSTAVTTNAASSTDGRYYMVERDSAEKLFVNIPWQNTTYGLATQSTNGLMSAADKTKLDHIGISVTGEEMTITLS
jgi:hypothetical protein